MSCPEGWFETCFIGLYRDIFTYAVTCLENEDLAEEVAQDAFLKLWEKKPKLKTEEDARKWLITVARNIILNFRREWSRHPVELSDEIDQYLDVKIMPRGQLTEVRVLNMMCLNQVADYLAELDELDWKIFMCQLYDRDWERLAKETGKSAHVLRSRGYYIRRKLKKKFGDHRG